MEMTPTTAEALPSHAPEKPVFAASSRARPHGLRLAGRIAAGLAALWLVALVLGAFGLGRLPGLNLPRITGGEPDAAKAPAPAREPSTRAASSAAAGDHLRSNSRYGGPAAAKRRGSDPANAAPPRRGPAAVRTSPTSGTPGSRGGASTGTTPHSTPA